ncbi:12190_t:CDS:1, partial [Funneliformis geosporum]
DTEGYSHDIFNLFQEIIGESRTNQANQEVIKCYYNFWEALSKSIAHDEKSYQPRAAARILVYNELRHKLPNFTEAEFSKKSELSGLQTI